MPLHLVREDEEPETITDFSAALQAYESLDGRIKELTRIRDDLKANIVAGMLFGEKKRVEAPSGLQFGKKYRATYTVPKRLKVDAKAIEAALGARRFARVSTRVLDENKLLAAIDKGSVARDLVTPHIHQVEGTPSVRFYTVDEKEGDDDAGTED